MKPVALVTGASDGLGRQVAGELARLGMRVLLHGRSQERTEQAAAKISKVTRHDDLRVHVANFERLEEVQSMAETILRQEANLNVVVLNAGLGLEERRKETPDGLEAVWQVNFVANALMGQRLLPLLRRSAGARVVSVASSLQSSIHLPDPTLRNEWTPTRAYGQSKLAQIAWTQAQARRESRGGPQFLALHPASCMPTKIVLGKFPILSSLEDGTKNVLSLCLRPHSSSNCSIYYENEFPGIPHCDALHEPLGDLLWEYIVRIAEGETRPSECWDMALKYYEGNGR